MRKPSRKNLHGSWWRLSPGMTLIFTPEVTHDNLHELSASLVVKINDTIELSSLAFRWILQIYNLY